MKKGQILGKNLKFVTGGIGPYFSPHFWWKGGIRAQLIQSFGFITLLDTLYPVLEGNNSLRGLEDHFETTL
jgi:hypothetical protein